MIPNPDQTSLTITRHIDAPRQKVFDAWSDPDKLKIWMGGKAVKSPYAVVDFRVGGKYQVRLSPPEGTPFLVEGMYQEIDPPNKIVYTWTFVGAEIDTGITLVTVEFSPLPTETTITLHHEKLPNQMIHDLHQQGWTLLLSNLGELFETI